VVQAVAGSSPVPHLNTCKSAISNSLCLRVELPCGLRARGHYHSVGSRGPANAAFSERPRPPGVEPGARSLVPSLKPEHAGGGDGCCSPRRTLQRPPSGLSGGEVGAKRWRWVLSLVFGSIRSRSAAKHRVLARVPRVHLGVTLTIALNQGSRPWETQPPHRSAPCGAAAGRLRTSCTRRLPRVPARRTEDSAPRRRRHSACARTIASVLPVELVGSLRVASLRRRVHA
jgi:hypothetical protein